MCKIRDAGKVKARDRIAVLASLNLAFDVSDAALPSFAGFGLPVRSDRQPMATERRARPAARATECSGSTRPWATTATV